MLYHNITISDLSYLADHLKTLALKIPINKQIPTRNEQLKQISANREWDTLSKRKTEKETELENLKIEETNKELTNLTNKISAITSAKDAINQLDDKDKEIEKFLGKKDIQFILQKKKQ